MTYKYLMLRRTMYEKNPASKLKSYRSWSDIKRLYRRPYLIMLIILLIAVPLLFVIIICNSKSPFISILTIIIGAILILIQIPRDKYLFNDSARAQELSKEMSDYEQYISDVRGILQDHGINTREKVMQLKAECEMTLKMREDKFAKMSAKIVDMLIGVPLGALIAGVIYTDSTMAPVAIGAIILIGFAILGILKLIRFIDYYSEGCYKDKYLLDSINDLDYTIISNLKPIKLKLTIGRVNRQR